MHIFAQYAPTVQCSLLSLAPPPFPPRLGTGRLVHLLTQTQTPSDLAEQDAKNSQAAQKGPDARRGPPAAREAYSLYVERAAKGANEADGPLGAAC